MLGSITRGRLTTALAMVCVAGGVFIALTSLGVGDSTPTVRRVASTPAPRAIYTAAAPHVMSGMAIYPVNGVFSSPRTQDPLRSAALFKEPVARYLAYSVDQLGLMRPPIARLRDALAADDRGAARAAWRDAYARYLRLGGVYLNGDVAALDEEINGSVGGETGTGASGRFAGLHGLERGLWSATQPRSLLASASRLEVSVAKMRRLLPHVAITPLEYATRAHEILEDAQRDFLSGADVPFSDEGVLATAAGLDASEEVMSTLALVFERPTPVPSIVETEFAALRSALALIAAAHGGRLPPDGQLTKRQSELLDGTLGGALEALSQVPGALDTEPLAKFAPIPRQDRRSKQ